MTDSLSIETVDLKGTRLRFIVTLKPAAVEALERAGAIVGQRAQIVCWPRPWSGSSSSFARRWTGGLAVRAAGETEPPDA